MKTSLATHHTLEFVKEYLAPNAKILEVGSGAGRLAAEMMKAGYQVTAIDLSPEKVDAARRNGVEAQVADISSFESAERFDAILFTRSLHHIAPLDPLLIKVKTLLGEKGRMLVEDFAHEKMDEKTAEWFYELREVFGALAGTDLPEAESALASWKKEHHHEPALHTSSTMMAAMERRFGSPHATTVPYLYRYFINGLEDVPHHAAAVEKIFEWEKKLIAKGLIQSIGLRIVAKKYFSYLK